MQISNFSLSPLRTLNRPTNEQVNMQFKEFIAELKNSVRTTPVGNLEAKVSNAQEKYLVGTQVQQLQQLLSNMESLPKLKLTGKLAEQLADMAFLMMCLNETKNGIRDQVLLQNINETQSLIATLTREPLEKAKEHLKFNLMNIGHGCIMAVPTLLSSPVTFSIAWCTNSKDSLGAPKINGDFVNAYGRLENAVNKLNALLEDGHY